MDKIEKFTQEKYDSFKIFLVSNFNTKFLKSTDSRISETTSIKTKTGKIQCNYTTNQNLEINPSNTDDESYKTIIDFLKKSNDVISDSKINDFVLFSKDFFAHISTCNECQNKVQDILSHMGKNNLSD